MKSVDALAKRASREQANPQPEGFEDDPNSFV